MLPASDEPSRNFGVSVWDARLTQRHSCPLLQRSNALSKASGTPNAHANALYIWHTECAHQCAFLTSCPHAYSHSIDSNALCFVLRVCSSAEMFFIFLRSCMVHEKQWKGDAKRSFWAIKISYPIKSTTDLGGMLLKLPNIYNHVQKEH